MAVATYTKTGSKASPPAKLDKKVFGEEIKNHQLLKEAYLAYMAGGRTNNAVSKRRGEVRGGGRKPWRQKGTGNARFGSSRNPIWRGGGVAFGPTGHENYSRKISVSAKQAALRQALSLAATKDRIKVIDSLAVADGKTKSAASLLSKIGGSGFTLLIAAEKTGLSMLAIRNLKNVKLVSAKYLNVFDIMNAQQLIFEKTALDAVHDWLGGKN
jgi:large subunit ribosomal protein L4